MSVKRMYYILLAALVFIIPVQAEEDIDVNVDGDYTWEWVDNFFNPVDKDAKESNVVLSHNCSYCQSEIQDPEGPDWWTPTETASACSAECIAKCGKRAEEAEVKEGTDDVRELFDYGVEYF